MGKLLPGREFTVTRSEEPIVLFFDDERADDVLSAVRSDTAREVFRTVTHEPMSASELAATLDMSVENVSYHLDALEDRKLIEVYDTVYSEKGREMDVYGVSEDPLVLFFGSTENEAQLRATFSHLASVLGPVAILLAIKQSLSLIWEVSS